MTCHKNYVLALDPSGAFDEGKGTTGWCLMDHNKTVQEHGCLRAVDFVKAEEFWNAHVSLIQKFALLYSCEIILEDYLLYANKATTQINSRMETCRLLGLLQWFCFTRCIDYRLQRAVDVKERWNDAILKRQLGNPEILEKMNKHEVDAVRHAMHWHLRNQVADANGRLKQKKRRQFTNTD